MYIQVSKSRLVFFESTKSCKYLVKFSVCVMKILLGSVSKVKSKLRFSVWVWLTSSRHQLLLLLLFENCFLENKNIENQEIKVESET